MMKLSESGYPGYPGFTGCYPTFRWFRDLILLGCAVA